MDQQAFSCHTPSCLTKNNAAGLAPAHHRRMNCIPPLTLGASRLKSTSEPGNLGVVSQMNDDVPGFGCLDGAA